MLVIPAIDLKNGKCVRLLHGDANKETIYSDNPVEMAKKWISQGATRLHIIDLDGAFQGKPINHEWIVRIKKETGIEIQTGGGIRNLDIIKNVIENGIDKVILGTIIFSDPEWAIEAFSLYKDKIMVALDVRDGYVAIRGWKDSSGISLDAALEQVEKMGGQDIIFTDIGRDGALQGVNVEAVKAVMSKTKMNVVASGGVSTMADIDVLREIDCPACIVGKAIYENKLDLAEAISRKN